MWWLIFLTREFPLSDYSLLGISRGVVGFIDLCTLTPLYLHAMHATGVSTDFLAGWTALAKKLTDLVIRLLTYRRDPRCDRAPCWGCWNGWRSHAHPLPSPAHRDRDPSSRRAPHIGSVQSWKRTNRAGEVADLQWCKWVLPLGWDQTRPRKEHGMTWLYRGHKHQYYRTILLITSEFCWRDFTSDQLTGGGGIRNYKAITDSSAWRH